MDKISDYYFKSKRFFIQLIATLLTNLKVQNFLKGTIYSGKLKGVCVPGLNCYSCPAALGACPIGSFQAVVGSLKYNFSFYVAGIMMFFGALFGRIICGFICPFGLFQDVIYKIKSKKLSTKKFKYLKYLKYLILLIVVWMMPVFFQDEFGATIPYFCKYICPQGILEGGIPLSIVNPGIRASLGNLFILKSAILILFIVTSIFIYRPFCKFICPLGAFYAIFNKFSIFKYEVKESKCIDCGKCEKVCDMDVYMKVSQDNLECIRCDKCRKVCPTGAICRKFK